jgi:hypothetical protein
MYLLQFASFISACVFIFLPSHAKAQGESWTFEDALITQGENISSFVVKSGDGRTFQTVLAILSMNEYTASIKSVLAVASPKRLLRESACRYAITGGFYADRNGINKKGGESAQGLVVIDGIINSAWVDKWGARGSGGVFLSSDTGGRIIRYDDPSVTSMTEINARSSVSHALQSTPLLIYDSRPDGADNTKKVQLRVAVGTTLDQEYILVLMHGYDSKRDSLSSFELGEVLLKLSKYRGIRTNAVLGLDSGSVGAIKAGRMTFGSSSKRYVPNIICFSPHERQ